MALVFISYKRGTDGVDSLKSEFEQRGYAVWFDKWSIKVGDIDWQESIDKGIEDADAFILCLTPKACDSIYIRHEVQQALEKQKRWGIGRQERKFIFPLLLEDLGLNEEITQNLQKLGLPERIQGLDLTSRDKQKEQLEVLFDEMARSNISPSIHVDRSRDRNILNQHQRYWRYLHETLGHLDLQPLVRSKADHSATGIDTRFEHGSAISDIYTPVPTDLRLIYDIYNYDIEKWWLVKNGDLKAGISHDARPSETMRLGLDANFESIEKEREAGLWDFAGLHARIQQRRIELSQEKEAQEYRRFGRLDAATEIIALNTEDAVAAVKRLVLVGDSGIGKTLFSRYFVTTVAQELETRPQKSKLSWWPHHDLNIVYVEMKQLAKFLKDANWDAQGLWSYIEANLNQANLMDYAPILRDELDNGTAILVIEDIDDVLTGRSRHIRENSKKLDSLMRSINTTFKDIRTILTMRSRALDHWNPDGMVLVMMQHLEEKARKEALQKYFNTFAPDAAEKLTIITNALANFDAKLAGNPRLIALRAALHQARPGTLYRRIVRLLLENEPEMLISVFDNNLLEKSQQMAIELLATFAYRSLEKHPMSEPPSAELYNLFRTILLDFTDKYDLESDAVINYLVNYSGLFTGSGDTFRFTHNDFRIYLAAEYVLKRNFLVHDLTEDSSDYIDERLPLRTLIEQEPQIWGEVFRILGDILPEFSDLVELIDELVEDETPEVLAPDAVEVNSAWLAGRIAFDQNILRRMDVQKNLSRIQVQIARQKVQELTNWLKLIVETPSAPRLHRNPAITDVTQRAEIGRLLGRLGDHRPGVGIDKRSTLPDIWWMDVLGTAEVPGFRISKYPITIEQFLAFVQAKGYEQERFWSEEGLQTKDWAGDPEKRWADSLLYPPNHPVANINWHEATAYVVWLNEQFPGLNIRLPSVLEWRHAVQGEIKSLYPYGEAYDALKANGRLTGVGRSSAVGLFQESDSHVGASDMSGNVYEWCTDIDDAEESTSPRRALCGGSWKSYPGFMTSNTVHYDYPENSSEYWGFRLVCDI